MKKLVPTFLCLFMLSVLVLPVVGCSGGEGQSTPESAAEDLGADDDLLPETENVDGADDA